MKVRVTIERAKKAPSFLAIAKLVCEMHAIEASDAELRAVVRYAYRTVGRRRDRESTIDALSQALRFFEYRKAGIGPDTGDVEWCRLFETYQLRKAARLVARSVSALQNGDAAAAKASMTKAHWFKHLARLGGDV